MKAKWMTLWITVIFVLALAVPCFAADYTYTLTFYAGKQGTLTEDCVTVLGKTYEVRFTETKVAVSGLHIGDRVTFHLEGVTVPEDSRYLVRGIRESGKDNSTVGLSDFGVTGDQDFVVAYGIKGSLTQYTVNYRDENGNTLGESRTYYGNVGDSPVVPYLYFDGYRPAAYNITKVLTTNSAENVFTFVYTRVTDTSAASQTNGSGTTQSSGSASTTNSAKATDPTKSASQKSVKSAQPKSNDTLALTELSASGEPVELLNLSNPGVLDMPGVQSPSEKETSSASWPLYAGIGVGIVAVSAIGYALVRAKRKKG